MADYIDRDKVLEAILDLPPKMDEQGYGWLGRMGVWQMIRDFQSADVAPMEWIPVTERLPDFEGCLLCMSKTAFGLSGQDVLYYEDGEFSYNGIDKLEGETVTHWMPLPEPPKDGER